MGLDRFREFVKMSGCNRQKSTVRLRGAATVEFSVAIGIVFLLLLFPGLDLLFMGFTYSTGYLLQSAQLRQAAMVKKSAVDAEMTAITTAWMSTGPGQFVNKGQSPPTAKVEYKSRLNGDYTVRVTTTVKSNSVMSIPGLSNVPGLGAPIEYTFTGERLMENPLYATQ